MAIETAASWMDNVMDAASDFDIGDFISASAVSSAWTPKIGEESVEAWIIFFVVLVALLVLDAFYLAPEQGTSISTSTRRVYMHCLIWVFLGLLFNVLVWVLMGPDLGLAWLNGYILEYLLSMDNLFIFIATFRTFGTPEDAKYKALFLGILGAIVLRTAFFGFGTAFFETSFWVQAIFGLTLVYKGIQPFWEEEEEGSEEDAANNVVLQLIWRCLPLTGTYDPPGALFTQASTQSRCRIAGTKLLQVVISLQVIDIIFAADSVIAKVSAHSGLFINFSSSAFAMVTLRSLFFVVEGLLRAFRFMNYAVSLILVFIGTKLVISNWVKIGENLSLLVIWGVFLIAIVASALFPAPKVDGQGAEDQPEAEAEQSSPASGPTAVVPEGCEDP